eukprot:TRINITY_DN43558_c0_g1_i2.p1 TRINITY_DN43558_c0_g1~~TRINITY_DN43558_c0_g1_i2.p1  ORF type:complete len:469 (-),score=111.52 TRINITY_DN43558_c0_g1_i2:190-1596(-)
MVPVLRCTALLAAVNLALGGTECSWVLGGHGHTGEVGDAFVTCAPEAGSTRLNVSVTISTDSPRPLRPFPLAAPSVEIEYIDVNPILYAKPTNRTAQRNSRYRRSTTLARVAVQGQGGKEYGNAGGPIQDRMTYAAQSIASAASAGADIILFPEEFFSICENRTTSNPEDPTPDTAACRAARANVTEFCANQGRMHQMWVVCTMTYHYDQGDERREANSAFVTDRSGALKGVYHKKHPVWEPGYGIPNEMRMPALSGTVVFDTDFGIRFCVVTCNDMMFNENWDQCAGLGADLVFFPSAWAGGLHLQARSWIHNVWTFNAAGPGGPAGGGCGPTGGGSCGFDNTGGQLQDGTDGVQYADSQIRVFNVETERAVYWANYGAQVDKMLLKYGGQIEQEPLGTMESTVSEVFVLRPARNLTQGFAVREAMREFNIPTLQEMQRWMRMALNRQRQQQQPLYPGANPPFPDLP